MSLKQPVLYSGINTLPNLHISNQTNVEVETCMCGYKPVIGEPFYYKSKYSDEVLVGIVKKIRPVDIISMNGTSYKKSEISIKPVDVRRNDILESLLNKIIIFIFLFFISNINAQETIITAGGDFNGVDGTISYSIGQVFYTETTSTNGYIQEGIQQVNSLNYWTGKINTDWNNTGNWSSGVLPDATSDVIITNVINQPIVSSDIYINTLTIEQGSTLTVPSMLNLTVRNYIYSYGELTLSNNTNLIQVDNVNNIGDITVKRNSAPLLRLDTTLWSSPVTGQNLFTFSPETLTNRFYTYDTATNLYTNLVLDLNSYFIPGKGFGIRAPNNQTSTIPTAWEGIFKGVLNNGTISFTLDNTAPGFNLVGNPYSSTIDASSLISKNLAIDGTLYFYTHSLSMDSNGVFPTGTNYSTWNETGYTLATHKEGDIHLIPEIPTGIIQVGQGFFVKANTSGKIDFTNDMRLINNHNQFLKKAVVEKNRLWINLRTESGTEINQILVGYITGATQGVDRIYDGI